MNKNEQTASCLKALGHPSRLMIARELLNGELSVSEVENKVNLSQASASQHLGTLRLNGIVDSKKQGTSKYYFLRDPGKIQGIIEILEVRD